MVEIKILSGLNSIGGNFIRIEDGDRTLIFDQGFRFDVMAHYYSGLISPMGLTELRDVGALPPPDWYKDADAVYITHMHLDHLGALSNIPIEARVSLPNLSFYEDMEERWRGSPSWLSLVPRRYYTEMEELKPLEVDENDVTAIPVSHSAYPSYALLYQGSDETVLYTGDFRIESYLKQEEFQKFRGGPDLLTYLGENPDIRIDTLIIEGTNIGLNRAPLLPEDTTEILRRLASSHRPIIATLHKLDFEYAYSLLKLAEDFDLECLLISPWTVKLLEGFHGLRRELKVVEEYVKIPTRLGKVNIEDIREKSIILTPYRETVDFLRELRSRDPNIGNPVAVLSEPEPEGEEHIEYGVMANWFTRLGIQHYRIRASGHYYPYQLREVVEAIKPKEIKPIHTLRPELLIRMATVMSGVERRREYN